MEEEKTDEMEVAEKKNQKRKKKEKGSGWNNINFIVSFINRLL